MEESIWEYEISTRYSDQEIQWLVDDSLEAEAESSLRGYAKSNDIFRQAAMESSTKQY